MEYTDFAFEIFLKNKNIEKSFGQELGSEEGIFYGLMKDNLQKSETQNDFLKGFGTDLQKQFPNGSWRTINGARVFLNGNKVVAGLNNFNGLIDDFFAKKDELVKPVKPDFYNGTWNGKFYGTKDNPYIYLNDKMVKLTPEQKNQLVKYQEEVVKYNAKVKEKQQESIKKKEDLEKNSTIQPFKNYLNKEDINSVTDLLSKHKGRWNNIVYGKSGSYHVYIGGDKIDISDNQEKVLSTITKLEKYKINGVNLDLKDFIIDAATSKGYLSLGEKYDLGTKLLIDKILPLIDKIEITTKTTANVGKNEEVRQKAIDKGFIEASLFKLSLEGYEEYYGANKFKDKDRNQEQKLSKKAYDEALERYFK